LLAITTMDTANEEALLSKQDFGDEVTAPANEPCLPKRRMMSLLLMLGFWNVYAMRGNLSLATEPMQYQYGWSEATKGLVLSSFFWGYVPFQIPGGILASKYGGKVVYGWGIFATSALTLAIPLCAPSLNALYIVRGVMGMGEAVTFPAANVLYTQWMPSAERAALCAFANSGSYLGTAFAFPIAGELIAISKDNTTYVDNSGVTQVGISTTWPIVFYFFGSVGCLWCVAWWWLAASSPEMHGNISEEEERYILATRGEDADKVVAKVDVVKSESIPWRGFFTSPAAWAIYIAHVASNWGAYTLLTFLPDYMDTQLHFDVKSSGMLSFLPYLFMFTSAFSAGAISDKMVLRMSVRRTRIIVLCTSYWSAAFFLLLTGYTTNTTLAVVFLTCSVGMSGIAAASYNLNYLDVSPHYAGQLFSVGNTIANVTGIVTPIVTGLILGDRSSASAGRWRLVFFITSAFYVGSTVIFMVFMKGKPVQELN
jgi:MFS family permease